MPNVTRNYKDNVFCMLYRDRKNLLSLYNVMNGTDYREEEALEVVTLDFAICVSMRNDAAFLIDSRLNLYEQQSTPNPNMPLRNLYYIAEELKRLVPLRALYGCARVRIPAPKFVVFYNGRKPQPAEAELRLSDLYEPDGESPELELVVRQININPGGRRDILEKCESLAGYMAFVNKVRGKTGKGKSVESAVTEAVEECIREGILSDFFTRHKNEVIEMGIYEYDAEVHDEVLREEAWTEGKAEGKAEGEKRGKAKMLLEMLGELGEVPKQLADRIMEQEDSEILNQWGRLVMKAGTVEEFKGMIQAKTDSQPL